MKSIGLLFLSLASFFGSYSQTWQDTLSLIEKTMIQYKPENPGCQLSISRNGEIIFSKAWGMADLEHHSPLTTQSVSEAGSVSKQFTAAAILLLQQQGKVSIDANVRQYVPELPDYGSRPILVRHLLHHTSGLREWSDIAELTGWSRGQKFYTNKDILEMVTRQKGLNFIPGAEYLYSNSNFFLLTLIVERVSGMSLPAFTDQYIFKPAGMIHTQWRDDPKRIVSNRAMAYAKSGNDYFTNMPNENVYGPGGLLTTTEDLLKWNDFYQSGKLGNPSIFPMQIATEPLNNGVMNRYAAGLVINKIMGWDNISHDGATASYRAILENFPELHLSIAMLSNTSQFNLGSTENAIRKIFVADKLVKKQDDEPGIHLPASFLQTIEGLYVNERNRATFQLTARNDTLVYNNSQPLKPVSKNIIKTYNFQFDISGGKGYYINYYSKDTIRVTKVSPATLAPKDFAAYEGTYFSEETNSTLSIQHDSTQLTLRLNANKVFTLTPTYKDAFKVEDLGYEIQFTRNEQGKPSSIRFYSGRTRGVEFGKQSLRK
ncbi:MAG: serine hydrolase [Bacteroidota bacterium]|nr:serine hydrolase [Bacteroidota bacterium]